MKRSHAMPFGPRLMPEGGVLFRLWAPSARTVELCLEQAALRAEYPMQAAEGGWFELVARKAGPGTRYAFRIDGGRRVPDPASRANPEDVQGPSEVVDAQAYDWGDGDWRGRPWEEAVIYELHVGCFSPEGTFAGVERRLDYLQALGITAVELMPVADFPGARNWGYDGVLPFAPDASYGRPEDLKRLVDAAHRRNLMVFLDVVYNHFGPEGNYLAAYADLFFNPEHHTPWGAAINFDGEGAATVRQFFIHNALYWLEEFHLDGLRFDAVHAMVDHSEPSFLSELAGAVRAGPGRQRHIHLILENDRNEARHLGAGFDAQWNDDIHHALHVLLTGERDGYYADYADAPLKHLGRCLAQGFAYQGEASRYRGGAPRGEESGALPATACVNFIQTHDQVGNRAFGERLAALASRQALEAATAIVLLAPAIPMLFMGEEFACPRPFQFFCDFNPELAQAVTRGRREEFARFARFADPAVRERIPDPNDPATFARSRLDWEALGRPPHDAWLALYRRLLALRTRWIVPHLKGTRNADARFDLAGERALQVRWILGDGAALTLLANLADGPAGPVLRPRGEIFYASHPAADPAAGLPPWSVFWFQAEAGPR